MNGDEILFCENSFKKILSNFFVTHHKNILNGYSLLAAIAGRNPYLCCLDPRHIFSTTARDTKLKICHQMYKDRSSSAETPFEFEIWLLLRRFCVWLLFMWWGCETLFEVLSPEMCGEQSKAHHYRNYQFSLTEMNWICSLGTKQLLRNVPFLQ